MKNYFETIGAWGENVGVGSYVTGFFVSLLLTFAAYHLATSGAFAAQITVFALLMLALLQFGAQVFWFLHLFGKGASRKRLAIFGIATGIILILLIGSLWIMSDLNTRMLYLPSVDEQEQYMQSQGGL